MKHLLICGEYPPATSGGIGTYAATMSRLLADAGETVHVVSKNWRGAESSVELGCDGKLIVHRIPYENWASLFPRRPHPSLDESISKKLFNSRYPPQCFSWCAALTAERIVAEEGIDVIEAQEYEAPLYYFQLRRALGMGPQRQPPCIIHLHSPTESIARHSEWNAARHDLAIAKHLEDYTIRAADQLLCPSHYLASQVASEYGFASDDVCVVPYPMGSNPVIERSQQVWSSGTVLYMGRLELRKGILEWIDAAVSVAKKRSEVKFEFVGDDTTHQGTSVLSIVRHRIPRGVASQFHFRGGVHQHELTPILKGARVCVVPSRWENFPNVCIEAMASGLPVIASDAGGMVEMVSEGETGWLGKPDPACLSRVLECALATPPEQLARMGVAAASRIRNLCDREAICSAHLSLRRTVVSKGAWNSTSLPKCASQALDSRSRQDSQVIDPGSGIAVIVAFSPNDPQLQQCLRSIRLQRRQPTHVVLATSRPVERDAAKSWQALLPSSWRISHMSAVDPISSREMAIESLLDSDVAPLGLVVITPKDELRPEFLELSESLLLSNPHVGVLTGWIASAKREQDVWMRPVFPLLRDSMDDAPCVVLRSSALHQCRHSTLHGRWDADSWHTAEVLVGAGWQSITIPRVWARHRFRNALSMFLEKIQCSVRYRAAGEMKSSPRPDQADLRTDTLIVWREKMNLIVTLLRSPLRTSAAVAARLKNKFSGRSRCNFLNTESSS